MASIQVRLSCTWPLGFREHLFRGRCCNVSGLGYSGPNSPSKVLIFLQRQYLVRVSRSTRKNWSRIFSSAVDDGMDPDDSGDETDKDESPEAKAGDESPEAKAGDVNSKSIRDNLERIVGKDDSAFSGLDLATLIRNKYGRSYDVQLIKKEFMGRNLLAMNVMWKYVEQKSFPLTEEEYLLRLDDVANTLKCWGAVSHIRNSLIISKERPRIGKAVSIFIDMDESGGRANEWIYRFMGAIDICNSSSCMIKPQIGLTFVHSDRSICSSFERKQRNWVSCMTSTAPVNHVKQAPQQLTGDSFIRPHLRKLSPYQPILPFEVLSTRLGRKPEDIIKLDANENPYGPPPEVFEALGALKFPYIYPDPESRRLRAALAEDSGLELEYILAGCGADELIDLIMRCVLDPGDKIVDCPPTFTMYEFDAAVNGALVIKVPRKSDFSLDVEMIAKVVEQEKPKCIFLTSPNNPDGSIIHEEALLKILDLPVLVVLDEAYIEFSGIDSKMGWVKKHENLIVLRTFSKRAGLAGLRVGYGAFPLSIIEYFWRAKQPYNVSVAAEVSACAALKNPTYLENVKVALVQERERLYRLLKEVPFLNPYPSYSNFILCEVTSGKDAKKLKEDLSKMGVMIRHYNNKELSGYVRVSVGKPDQTDALMNCLNSIA